MSTATLQRIDERRLEKDLAYRFGYLTEFMGFGEDDVQAIYGMAPYLAPVVPAQVDAVYEKLFSYDTTKRQQYDQAMAAITQHHALGGQ